MGIRHRRRSLIAGLVGFAMLAACGGDGGTDPAGSGDPSSDARSPASAEVADAGEIGEVTVSGDPLPEFAGADAPDPAVGRQAPEITGTGVTGGDVRVGGAGPQVVAVVAHWCPHCQREVPKLADWLADSGLPDSTDMVAVSTAQQPDGPNWPPSAWLRDEGWRAPVLADSATGEAAAALGVSGFPFFVLIDADGTVASRFSGEIGVDELSRRIDATIA